MGKLGLNSGYIGSDQRTTTNGVVGYDKYFLERANGRFIPVLSVNERLLDIYNNSYIALSVRKLSSSYGGPSIRVRRSSDNTEQDIGFDSNDNLNLLSLISFLQGSNGFITTWYDQSGNNRHFTQITAGNQPLIEISPSGLSRSSLNNSISSFLSNNNISTLSGTYSVFIATKATSFTSTNYFLGTPSSLHLGWRSQNNPTIAHFSNDAEYSFSGTTNPLLHTLIYKSPGSQYWINNNSIGTNLSVPSSGIGNRNILYLGAGYLTSQTFRGYIQEVIIYADDKTTDVSNINTNINNYFNYY